MRFNASSFGSGRWPPVLVVLVVLENGLSFAKEAQQNEPEIREVRFLAARRWRP